MTGFAAAAALLVLTAATITALYAAGRLVAVARDPLRAAPFTGGLPPVEHAVSRYHVRWYAVSMVFLTFDMEMIFMYLWTRVITATGASSVVEMFTFLAVLVAGIAYAYREGALRWT